MIGNWSHPFRISIPTSAMDKGASTLHLNGWKVVWRVDVSIDHRPIPYVGTRISKAYALNLYTYVSPLLPPLTPPLAINVGQDACATQLFITAPSTAYGPGDTLSVGFHAQPNDHTTIVKKVAVYLDRRIEFLEEKSPTRDPSPDSTGSGKPSFFGPASSSPAPRFIRLSSDVSVSPLEDSSGRVLTACVAEGSSITPTPGSGGSYWCSTEIHFPNRGGKNWDMGETRRTKLVSVSYELRIKMSFKSTKGKASGRDFTCSGIPVVVVATSAAERADAQALIAAATPEPSSSLVAAKRKHRSSRRGLYMHEGTTDITEAAAAGQRSRRGRNRSKSDLPVVVSLFTGIVADIKPILRRSAEPQEPMRTALSFSLPHTSSEVTSRSTRPPDTAVQPISVPPTPASLPDFLPSERLKNQRDLKGPLTVSISTSPSATTEVSPTHSKFYLSPASEVESYSIIRQFQQSGRRISTTSTEDDEMQPSRVRQKTLGEDYEQNAPSGFRPSLPSLSALGLGLPPVHEERPFSRPRTAPLVSTFARTAHVPPPLSGRLSETSITAVRPKTLLEPFADTAVVKENVFAFDVPATDLHESARSA